MNARADPNITLGGDIHPLFKVMTFAHADRVGPMRALLLEAGADIEVEDSNGLSALTLACVTGTAENLDTVEVLVAGGSISGDVDATSGIWTAMAEARGSGGRRRRRARAEAQARPQGRGRGARAGAGARRRAGRRGRARAARRARRAPPRPPPPPLSPTPRRGGRRPPARVRRAGRAERQARREPALPRAAARLSLIHISEPTRLLSIWYGVLIIKKK